MTSLTRARLSAMMFLQYFIWSMWYVTLGNYLASALHFSGQQIATVFGAGAIAAMISPFFVGLVADRFFATERVLGAMHLLGALLMFQASQVSRFAEFYPLILGYTLTYFPTVALTNAVAFHQLENPQQQFPGIRAWGTLGWIMAGLSIAVLQSKASAGFSWQFPFFLTLEKVRDIEGSALPMRLAAGVSLLMGLYAFTLPHTPPARRGQRVSLREVLGLDALMLFRERSFQVVFASAVLICVPLMFYFSFTNQFLNEIGFENAAGKMTLGQISEYAFILVMPFFFRRVSVKWMMLIGMLAWPLRYSLFGFGNADSMAWMLYLGIILHGICYDFFFVTAYIYADRRAPLHLRSSVQGLMTFATYGVGFFLGSLVSGKIVDQFRLGENGHNWLPVWLIPAGFAALVALGFLLFFRESRGDAEAG